MATQSADQTSRRALVVAIHDVAPPFESAVRAELQMLADVGVRRCVLKVVPNWHGAHPLPLSPSLVDLLQSQLETGSQIVLHGYEHRRRGQICGTPCNRFRAVFFAGDAAEFITLNEAEAERALREGLDLLTSVGLPRPTAFCAPGWLINSEGEAALKQAGFRQLIGMLSVRDFGANRRLRIPGFGYMGATPTHEALVGLVNRLMAGPFLARSRVAKAYLHPYGNLRSPALRLTLARIARLVGEYGWQSTTFSELWENGEAIVRAD